VLRGHAIEARVYAEDPRADFLPSTGTLACWDAPDLPGVRWESGVETGSEVTIHYDPMLAKVIAHAPTRDEAAQRLARALRDLRVHGVRTNVPLLVRVIAHPEFLAGRADTHFLGTRLRLDDRPTPAEEAADRLHAVAVALWFQERRRAEASVLRGLPSGWRNNPSQPQEIAFTSGDVTIAVRYRVHPHGRIAVEVDGETADAAVLGWDAGHVALVLDGLRRTVRIVSQGGVLWAHSVLGSSELREVPRFPAAAGEQVAGGCRAPMPGRILAVRSAPGERVTKGQVLVVLEAMKMEHEVVAPHDGVVREVMVEAGQQVDTGDVLVILDEHPKEEASA